MLTNKKKIILFIITIFFFTSCGINNVKLNSVKDVKNDKKIQIENLSGKKGKSIGGEQVDKKEKKESVSDSGLKF